MREREQRGEREGQDWLDTIDRGIKQEYTSFLTEIFRLHPQPLVVGHPDGRVILCNPAFCRLTGYTEEELLGMSWDRDLTPPEWQRLTLKAAREMHKTGQPQRYEKEYLRKDGTRVPVEVLFYLIPGCSDGVRYYCAFITDISERRRAQAAVKTSEPILDLVADNMLDMISQVDREGVYLYVSPSHKLVLGYDAEEMLGHRIFHFLHPDDMGKVADEVNKCIQERRSGRMRYRYRHARGHYVWLETNGSLILGENNEVVGAVFTCRDITEQKRVEEELNKSNRRLIDIIEFLPDATFVIDHEKKVIAWNRAMEEMTGVTKEDIIGRGGQAYAVPFYGEPRPMLIDLIGENSRETQPQYGVTSSETDTLYAEVYVPFLFGGRGAFVWVKSSPLYDSEGNLVGAIESIRDITAWKQAERSLRESEARLRQITDNMLDMIVQTDIDGNFVYISPSIKGILGYDVSEMMNESIFDYVHRADLNKMLTIFYNAINDLSPWTAEVRFRHRDGRFLWLECAGNPLFEEEGVACGTVFGARDVTERKRVEERLRHLSLHDSLTGLYNRAYFEQQMQQLAELGNGPVGLLLCDVDGLKLVNDTLGHVAGDRLLIAAARVIAECAGPSMITARVGGDEFAVLIPNGDMEKVSHLRNRIQDAAARRNRSGIEIPLSISIGFTVGDCQVKGAQGLFKEADNSMYREKLYGRKSARNAIVKTLMQTLEARNLISVDHVKRLQKFLTILARALQLSERKLTDLCLLARYHDIGKVGVSDQVLFKTGPLTPEETAEMQRHCEIGHRIALASSELGPIADWILKHHEWWDGSGYPLGLCGDEIPLECRLLSIVDAYDAMTSRRPYREPLSRQQALKELERYAGVQFDPDLVKLFVRVLGPAHLL